MHFSFTLVNWDSINRLGDHTVCLEDRSADQPTDQAEDDIKACSEKIEQQPAHSQWAQQQTEQTVPCTGEDPGAHQVVTPEQQVVDQREMGEPAEVLEGATNAQLGGPRGPRAHANRR